MAIALHLIFNRPLRDARNDWHMNSIQMIDSKFNRLRILFAEREIRCAALFFFLVISLATVAQFEGSSLTREGRFDVDWLSSEDSLVPVGQFAPVDGFWLDEIPWGVFELELPAHWRNAQDLVTQPEWAAIDAEDLTERQRSLLKFEKNARRFKLEVLRCQGRFDRSNSNAAFAL